MKTTISSDNQLTSILDFDVCKRLVNDAEKNNENAVILCTHYSINIASKYEDGEALQWDLDELSDYIGRYVEVSDYDDLIVCLKDEEEGFYDAPRQMPSDAIRLHFWSEDKSCYIVTDCISEAVKAMADEYENHAIATNQTTDILLTDTELYYL